MPPGGAEKRLSADVRLAFREWIRSGAPYVQAEVVSDWDFEEADLWAFRPVVKVKLPTTGVDPASVRTSVDSFVLAKLAEQGIAPAPAADRVTLIRRVTYDLTGLPPTPEEVEAFVNDDSGGAYKALVDRLLDSPRYGERWGRHWLDVTRYADTAGYSNDFERPNAWRYRDYVIRSFNDDKPYDQFVLEQVAGDELFPDSADAIIATGFLRSGPWEHTGMAVAAVSRQLFLDDVTHHVGQSFLGLTLGCARCHDHKFDPIPTQGLLPRAGRIRRHGVRPAASGLLGPRVHRRLRTWPPPLRGSHRYSGAPHARPARGCPRALGRSQGPRGSRQCRQLDPAAVHGQGRGRVAQAAPQAGHDAQAVGPEVRASGHDG